jgi:F-type H+-transporting ATPase subunit delta
MLGSAPLMIVGSIARRYAKALFALASERGRIEEWLKGLDALKAAVDSSAELKDVLANPVYEKDQRRAIAGKLAKALALDDEPANLLYLLGDRNRLGCLAAIVDHFRDQADQKLGRVRAKVTSAVALDEATARGLAQKLAEASKAEVIVERQVDPDLLGGVVAQVGRFVYDGSVRAQLEELRRTLKE